jgi:excisionase family DNA binding protein
MMTLPQAAAILGLAPSTLRHAIRRGQLEAEKVGYRWTVSVAAVDRYRQDHRGRRGYPKGRPRK